MVYVSTHHPPVTNTFIHFKPEFLESKRSSSCPPSASEVGDGQIIDDSEEHPMSDMNFTTLMLGNLPCCVSKKRLEAELWLHGFRGALDSIHVPTRASNGSNRSYGFVRFLHLQDAQRFAQVFNGYKFLGSKNGKVCYVKGAKDQVSLPCKK